MLKNFNLFKKNNFSGGIEILLNIPQETAAL